jgi:hypothetical protein
VNTLGGRNPKSDPPPVSKGYDSSWEPKTAARGCGGLQGAWEARGSHGNLGDFGGHKVSRGPRELQGLQMLQGASEGCGVPWGHRSLGVTGAKGAKGASGY